TAGWGSWAAQISRVAAADAPDGSFVARVAAEGNGTFTIDEVGATVGSAQGGSDYLARAWVKAADPSSVGKPLSITLRQAARGDNRKIRGPEVLLSNEYQLVTARLDDAAAGGSIDLYIAQSSARRGNAFFIDQIALNAQ
ncbi:MAG: hypothetical protein ACR2N6_02580, partial [Miltoncostaeaceae bacterium]